MAECAKKLSRVVRYLERTQQHVKPCLEESVVMINCPFPNEAAEKRPFAKKAKVVLQNLESTVDRYKPYFDEYKAMVDELPDEEFDAETGRFDTHFDFDSNVQIISDGLRRCVLLIDEEIQTDQMSILGDTSAMAVTPSAQWPASESRQGGSQTGLPAEASRPMSKTVESNVDGANDVGPTPCAHRADPVDQQSANEQSRQLVNEHRSESGPEVTRRGMEDRHEGGSSPPAVPPQCLDANAMPFVPMVRLDSQANQCATPDEFARASAMQTPIQAQEELLERFTSVMTQALNTSSRGGSRKKIILPKFDLPKFSGRDLSKWKPFRDKFHKNIGSDPDMSGSDKLTYLGGYLEGEAYQAIENLDQTDENYEVAMATLTKRYGNPTVAIEQIQSKINNLAPVPNGRQNLEKLKKFFNDLENLLGALKALNADTQSPYLIQIIQHKLPPYTLEAMELERRDEGEWSMTDLLKSLEHQIRARETAKRRARPEEHDQRRESKSSSDHKKKVGTTSSFVSNEQRKKNPRQRPAADSAARSKDSSCVFCDRKGHISEECRTVRSAQDRVQKLKAKRCCFKCLSAEHGIRECESAAACSYCQKTNHHPSICYRNDQPKTDQARASNEDSSEPTNDLSSRSEQNALGCNESTLMKTAICAIKNPNDPAKSMKVRVFFDCGASRSFITMRSARALGLPKENHQRLMIERFDDRNSKPFAIDTYTAKLDIQTKYRGFWRITVAICDQTMESMTRRAVPKHVLESLPANIELADDPVPKSEKVDVDIMIGNDFYDDFIGWDRPGTRALKDGFWLVDSEVGWMISGRIKDEAVPTVPRSETAAHVLTSTMPVEHAMLAKEQTRASDEFELIETGCPGTLEDLWSLEAIGVRDANESDVTDDHAIENFNKTVKFENGRYQVTWPWRPDVQKIPSNYGFALRKLKCLLARAKAKNRLDFLERYHAIFMDQLGKDIIEVVEVVATDNRLHYLAHHGVETPLKATTKLRIVYDASARETPDQPSLNECMFRGQVYLENLMVLRLRFRCYPIALVADIEKAFLQIELQESERDVTRFLWVKDVIKPPEGDNLMMFRYKRVSFGVIASPFLLGATMMYHLKQQVGPIARKIEANTYVDNVVTGVDTHEEAERFYSESKAMFAKAGMNLREFGSNDYAFVESLPEKDQIEGDEVKVLGVLWDRRKDCFRVKVPAPIQQRVTKRTILSNLFKMFDPDGFVCPVTVAGKLLLQEVTRKKYSWNTEVPEELQKKWAEVSRNLEEVSEIEVPRYVGKPSRDGTRLMVFCDASQSAYAAVAYLQNRLQNGHFSSHLIFAKARVCPLKKMTIPRLELMALLIGVRAAKFVRESIEFDGPTVMWSDSTTALHWIHSKKLLSKFVKNRVKEIREGKKIEFRHVPTKENPADRASRGAKASELDKVWFQGPAWCHKGEDEWPKVDTDLFPPETDTAEEQDAIEEAGMTASDAIPETPYGLNPDHFETLHELVRATAWVNRVIDALVNWVELPGIDDVMPKPAESRWAMTEWILWAQEMGYRELIGCLQTGKKHQMRKNVGAELDSCGIIRCKTRIQRAQCLDDAKSPVLLPSKSRITELIIAKCHTESCHAGVGQTLCAVNANYWVPKGRARVKAVVSRCRTCREHDGGPYARPMMDALPATRVTRSQPFTHVGVDYFGPLLVKVREDGSKKRWVCLITCLATRAIHLEVVKDLSGIEFLYALRRFSARRGVPKSVVCDNAPQFKVIKATLAFTEHVSANQIEWTFIPQFAPWAGGVYERMVGVVKSAMKKTIGKQLLTSQQLETLTVEIEYVVNCRPLTYIGDDVHDLRILRPNDLLGLQSAVGEVVENDKEPEYTTGKMGTREEILATHKKLTRTLEEFWKVWSSDYLLSMRNKQTWHHKHPKTSVKRVPAVGDVVLVKDPARKRNQWNVGKVTELIVSKDGAVRAVHLHMDNQRPTVRPVSLLYPLECEEKDSSPVEQPTADEVKTEGKQVREATAKQNNATSNNPRPRRKTAEVAISRLKDQFSSDSE